MLRSSVQKLISCLIAGLVCGATFLRIGRRFLQWVPPLIIVGITICILLTAILYSLKWMQKKEQDYNASATLGFCQGVIRYGIAIDLILFGFQKFFGLQFSMPLGLLDLPFSNFSGEDLTFAYFSHSFAFVVIIASFQILGSVLLLFNRTKLMGVFILLPVMVNIVLLNICYKMEAGELAHSSILLIALLYLLLSEYNRLVAFFFNAKNGMPSVVFSNQLLKNFARLSAVAIPLLLIWSYRIPEKHAGIYGKYKVSQLRINGQRVADPSCKDSVLTLVYLDQNADCVFEYNSQQKRLIGNYHLDEKTNKMTIAWRFPDYINDTLFANISSSNPKTVLKLSGKMGNQFLEMALIKVASENK